MNLSLETLQTQLLLLDGLGLLGLAIIALASAHLAARHRSWGGTMMACGASAVLVARLYLVLAPHLMTPEVHGNLAPATLQLVLTAPQVLLHCGLAGVVWGLWGHVRLMRSRSR